MSSIVTFSCVKFSKFLSYSREHLSCDHSLIPTSLNPREYLYQIWRDSLKSFLRYHFHEYGMDGQTDAPNTQCLWTQTQISAACRNKNTVNFEMFPMFTFTNKKTFEYFLSSTSSSKFKYFQWKNKGHIIKRSSLSD